MISGDVVEKTVSDESIPLENKSIIDGNGSIMSNGLRDKGKRVKNKRRGQGEYKGKSYTCSKCNKSYLSYPALYTHKRNKHNVIPITNKLSVFRSYEGEEKVFKYNAVELNVEENIDSIEKILIESLNKLYCKPESVLFKESFEVDIYFPLKIIRKFKSLGGKVTPPPKELNPPVDDLISRYLILFNQVSTDKSLSEKTITFLILVREYLNLIGWDMEVEYARISDGTSNLLTHYPYTTCQNASNIPYLLQNMYPSFFNLDDNNFGFSESEILDFIMNFSNWLFINNYTSFKIIKTI